MKSTSCACAWSGVAGSGGRLLRALVNQKPGEGGACGACSAAHVAHAFAPISSAVCVDLAMTCMFANHELSCLFEKVSGSSAGADCQTPRDVCSAPNKHMGGMDVEGCGRWLWVGAALGRWRSTSSENPKVSRRPSPRCRTNGRRVLAVDGRLAHWCMLGA